MNFQDLRKRRGRFEIDRAILEDQGEVVMQAFTCVFVSRCEFLWDMECFQYTGISVLFDEIEDGIVAPFYDILVTNGVPRFVRRIE